MRRAGELPYDWLGRVLINAADRSAASVVQKIALTAIVAQADNSI